MKNAKRWNDCWYDQKRRIYVTYNKYFKGIPDARTRDIQIEYEKESRDNGIVIEEDRIKFFFGYPSLKLTYETSGNSVNFLLPTLTDEMITKEIIKARLMPESDDNAIMYETQSEPWIGVGTKLVLTEKEYELGKDLGRYDYVSMDTVKTVYKR